MNRRHFLGVAGCLALATATKSAEPNDVFDPEVWL
jgi:hypothetical protein